MAHFFRKKASHTNLLYIIFKLIYLLLAAERVIMAVRVVIDLLPLDDDNPLVRFVYLVTEPLIAPVRSLLNLWFDVETMPVDVAFFVTFAVVGVLVWVVRI